ncbi:glycerol-3-phosphate dehydrogenase/oxidase [Pseudotabrizicola alkalilacus]|uniref:Glycerol-3-phosphate dehydrogenase/oxidase n=1 Tax=Pseudotabrizicola alkalilacus TaxID=2305252 RepID=A0A411YWX0_9RHOB|nr:glycerol-3-phosphate dehydrogenase/oxidase [Pseudotabrizicola alkalilacus]RGP35302.1 glycerol-3-phosphate dehydrogenase/oxidase [Pseudotabrizicola alkalilacus]
MRDRQSLLNRLRSGEVPDILIIGGGINGVGAYRDLAAQGIPALLVEAEDFASGTSAAPSRLIHGGLRYLETGEAALVRESLTERNLLLKNAAHLVHPQKCWVPLRSLMGGAVSTVARFLKLTRTPGPKGAVPVKIGLMLYDVFGRAHQTMPDHKMFTAREARRQVPPLATDLRAVAQYYDARITHPERLVMELVADAEADCPDALAVPYVAAGKQDAGRITLHDRLTGETFEVTPKLVVNASGAWVDTVQHDLGINKRVIGGTRGSHLVVRDAQLAGHLGDRMLYFETDDHRACLIYRLEDDRLLVGTTDIRSDNPDDKTCTEAEIDYIFDVLRPILPTVRLTRAQIVFAFAGVRPLPLSSDGATGAISRDHRLDVHEPLPQRPFHLLTLVGGKWTTYRVCGEQIADMVMDKLGLTRQRSTTTLAIGGAEKLPRDTAGRAAWVQAMAQDNGLTSERCAALAQRYGSHATVVAGLEGKSAERYQAVPGYTPAEIGLICRSERVTRLTDILLRRTLMGFEGGITLQGLDEIAGTAAHELGWDQRRTSEEVAQALELLRGRHRMTIR